MSSGRGQGAQLRLLSCSWHPLWVLGGREGWTASLDEIRGGWNAETGRSHSGRIWQLWGMGRGNAGGTRANAWPGSVVLLGSANAAGLWTLSLDGYLTHELQCR